MAPANQDTALSPSDLVIFGGTGDLAARKILPALYYRLRDGQLPASSRVFILGRRPMERDAYLKRARKACERFVTEGDFSEKDWKRFASCLDYRAIDATKPAQYDALKKTLSRDPRPVRVFYLATSAELFGPISAALKEKRMITEGTRVVLEKPIGHDLASFRATNRAVLDSFREGQIYRIDHYLGKETVQNLMVLRFGNHLFEKIWNGDVIDHVQITVAEEIGVGERFAYYDSYGALRDMVQNHLLQLLCLVAMEAPPYITPDAVRDEKLKVLHSLRPMSAADVATHTVRGQYRGYRDDIGGGRSDTETFVALKTHIDNWRWSGTPFYLRTGKRLAERYSEIVIQFKPIPHNIFPHMKTFPETNKLIIRLQPDETVKLEVNTKVPGPGGYRLKPVQLSMSLAEEFGERIPDAYERLLMDVVRGNPTLFMRSDEVEAAWEWTEYLLTGWKKSGMKSRPYAAGGWGPKEAAQLLARDGLRWYEQR
ncbi:MAG: glucose-6-phosphate dehydrogenase [Alphaproteobacteria bacterium]